MSTFSQKPRAGSSSTEKPSEVERSDGSVTVDRPWTVWFVAVVVLIQSLGLLVAGTVCAMALMSLQLETLVSGVFLCALCFLLGIGLCLVGLNFLRGLRWTRAAVFSWQLLMVALIFPAVLSGYWMTLGILVVLVAVVIILFTPRLVAYTLKMSATPAL